MAQFKIDGLVQLQEQLAKISELDNGREAKKMLEEGSKEVKKTWQKVAAQRHNKHTGLMKAETESSKPKKNKYGRFTVTYPRNAEERIRHGVKVSVRNAEKAFYQHYGYWNPWLKAHVPGDRWVDIVEVQAEPLADKAMQAEWDRFLKETNK